MNYVITYSVPTKRPINLVDISLEVEATESPCFPLHQYHRDDEPNVQCMTTVVSSWQEAMRTLLNLIGQRCEIVRQEPLGKPNTGKVFAQPLGGVLGRSGDYLRVLLARRTANGEFIAAERQVASEDVANQE